MHRVTDAKLNLNREPVAVRRWAAQYAPASWGCRSVIALVSSHGAAEEISLRHMYPAAA